MIFVLMRTVVVAGVRLVFGMSATVIAMPRFRVSTDWCPMIDTLLAIMGRVFRVIRGAFGEIVSLCASSLNFLVGVMLIMPPV
ncbi:hypothetical protein [Leucobacter sp. W1153]|uniref:hypothetical protein n=1 Tax=unclassified Leucobacter TaxID=2621730 RepID=UPI003F3A7C7A